MGWQGGENCALLFLLGRQEGDRGAKLLLPSPPDSLPACSSNSSGFGGWVVILAPWRFLKLWVILRRFDPGCSLLLVSLFMGKTRAVRGGELHPVKLKLGEPWQGAGQGAWSGREAAPWSWHSMMLQLMDGWLIQPLSSSLSLENRDDTIALLRVSSTLTI